MRVSKIQISKNLHHEIEKLKAAPAWQQPTGRSSELIVKYSDFRIILMVMKAGTSMGRHSAQGRIAVNVIEGKIRFRLGESKSIDMSAGELLTLDRGVEHDVEALEESAFLLTVVPSQPEL
jgi:quercetin dioxygenase-like cupin family protein